MEDNLNLFIDKISNIYEKNRIEILSKELLNKYKTLEEIKNNKDDPSVIEFIELLNDLNSLSSFISNAFKNELEV